MNSKLMGAAKPIAACRILSRIDDSVAFVEPPMTIGPPWYLKVYAAMRKMYTSPRYTNDETRCVSVHAHEHALHAIDAQHDPRRLPRFNRP